MQQQTKPADVRAAVSGAPAADRLKLAIAYALGAKLGPQRTSKHAASKKGHRHKPGKRLQARLYTHVAVVEPDGSRHVVPLSDLAR